MTRAEPGLCTKSSISECHEFQGKVMLDSQADFDGYSSKSFLRNNFVAKMVDGKE